MPGFNGTGPAGMGPMSGGGRGLCNPSQASYGQVPTWGPDYGRGFGRGCGRGPGFGSGLGFSRGRGYERGFGRPEVYPLAGKWQGPAYGTR